MRRWPALLSLLFSLAAFGAETTGLPPDGQIMVDLSNVFLTVYQSDTWLPVDVFVRNNDADLDGHLEIQLFGMDPNEPVPLNPVYKVPVNSPKGSIKRFRTYCHFAEVGRLSVMLYRKSRPLLPMPVTMNMMPIRANSSVCLVVDKEPTDYSALYNAASQDASRGGFYRISIPSAQLDLLPEKLQCYDFYDMIVLGDMELSALPQRYQELLRQYVSLGGVLVACTGENAGVYRGSWVANLAGVTIGEPRPVTETQLAEQVFADPGDRGKLEEQRTGEAATLTPAAAGVYYCGEADAVLATLREVGSGYCAVVATDAASKLLHDSPGYLRLWDDLLSLRRRGRRMDLNYLGFECTRALPELSGIRIHPRETIITYLGAYLLVGVIANFLFWGRLKRLEWAWISLIILSAGFTAYAVFFGTSGRAKSSQIQEIDVVQLPRGGGLARHLTISGLLAAYSGRFDLELTSPEVLVRQSAGDRYYYGGSWGEAPFSVVQADPPRIEGLRVGASEMKVLEVNRFAAVEGGIEGNLKHDGITLTGALRNTTGLRLTSPILFYHGVFYRMGDDGAGGIIPTPERLDSERYYERGNLQALDNAVRMALGADSGWQLDTSAPPYLFAVIDQANASPAVVSEDADTVKLRRYLLADVLVTAEGEKQEEWLDLVVFGPRRNGYVGEPSVSAWQSQSDVVWQRAPEPIEIAESQAVRGKTSGVTVELYWTSQTPETDVVFRPFAESIEWVNEHRVVRETTPLGGLELNKDTYHLEDLATYQNRAGALQRSAAPPWQRSGQSTFCIEALGPRANVTADYMLRVRAKYDFEQQGILKAWKKYD